MHLTIDCGNGRRRTISKPNPLADAAAEEDRTRKTCGSGLQQTYNLNEVAFTNRIGANQYIQLAQFDRAIVEGQNLLKVQPLYEHRVVLNISPFELAVSAGWL